LLEPKKNLSIYETKLDSHDSNKHIFYLNFCLPGEKGIGKNIIMFLRVIASAKFESSPLI